jgi:SnoaL-like domain
MGGNRELANRFIESLEARDWDAWAGLLHSAVVYEIPQSRERIRGRDRYLRFNQEYPGDWHLRPKVTIADERHGVVWFEWLLDGRTDDAMAFFEFADGLITRVTDFWPEPYEPPPGREHLVERWLPAPRGSSLRSLKIGFSADKAPAAHPGRSSALFRRYARQQVHDRDTRSPRRVDRSGRLSDQLRTCAQVVRSA